MSHLPIFIGRVLDIILIPTLIRLVVMHIHNLNFFITLLIPIIIILRIIRICLIIINNLLLFRLMCHLSQYRWHLSLWYLFNLFLLLLFLLLHRLFFLLQRPFLLLLRLFPLLHIFQFLPDGRTLAHGMMVLGHSFGTWVIPVTSPTFQQRV